MICNSLTANDLNNIVKIHLESFPNFFLSSLGPKFLSKFYKSILLDKNGVGIGLFDNGELKGFAIGTKNKLGFYRNIIKNNLFSFSIIFIFILFKTPLKLAKIIRNLYMSSMPNSKQSIIPFLLSICIQPHESGKGLGKTIIKCFEDKMVSFGIKELFLTTDAENNEYTNLFYKRNNYKVENIFLQGKRKMILYYKKLS